MKTAFIYSDRFASFSYGFDHPMRPVRLRITYELIEALGLFDLSWAEVIPARRATDEEILSFHTPEYLSALKEADSGNVPREGIRYGLGYGDNPAFRGVFEWSSYSTGASVQAGELVVEGRVDSAFNIAGGLHHAFPDRASGFCYINDPVVVIKYLLKKGKRVAYVDIDAHHGDGVEQAFYNTRDVLTISIHEDGRFLFPGTGSINDTGEGEGRGYSVNVPLPPGAGDDLFIIAFEDVVVPFVEAFAPDVLVTQLGVDTFRGDPITHLNLTTSGFERMIYGFRSFGCPWVALGGGGYNIFNVARAWTIVWAVMNGMDVPERVPDEIKRRYGDVFVVDSIRDTEKGIPPSVEDIESLKRNIDFLMREVLPLCKV